MCSPGYMLFAVQGNYTYPYFSCAACSSNCISCDFDTNTQKIMCKNCSDGYMLLGSGVCFECGSTNTTIGC